MTSDAGGNRRGELRAAIELKVEYKRLNSFFADYTKNISRGGTFIRTDKPLEIGTEFRFLLTVPRLDKPIELRGRVQWIVRPDASKSDADPGMGIGFIYENEAERARVGTVVERLMIESLGPVLFAKLVGRDPR